MKKKPASKSAFFNPRLLITLASSSLALLLALGVAWSASSLAPPAVSKKDPGQFGNTRVPAASSGQVAAPDKGSIQQMAEPNALFAILYDQTDSPGANAT